MTKDRIFAAPRQEIAPFSFDARVAEVFTDMVQRSVPGYGMMLEMIGVIAGEFVTANSHCYDLGCSLGAAALSMRQGIQAPGCRIFAIDNSAAMIARCREQIIQDEQARAAAGDSSPVPLTAICEDITASAIEQASMVVMNLTLQFIPPEQRPALLAKIHAGLQPGGVLVLSEKISAEEETDNELLIKLYHDFKKTRGYSELEIAQKRNALERVLIPDTPSLHRQRLLEAGFSRVIPWFQCFNFMSYLAIK